MILVKDLDKHFNDKISYALYLFYCWNMCWLLPSVCSTSHALAVLIFKKKERRITCLEVFPCICK